ncbi:MAG: polyprenyl synthetase family protein [Candidatus Omnitrophota bacterium]|nr:polyprenyl synthetase family protein [Candidatus Omnitrophota bacterium]
MFDKMIQRIDQGLGNFLDKIRTEYRLHLVDPILYKSMREFVLRKGKRLRPLLLILGYQGYRKSSSPMSPSIYYVSTCIELLHNFMLIHDDIIDRSSLRRGKPTMHKLLAKAAKTKESGRLGHDLAIVVGDIVYASAFDAFLSIHEDPARKEQALKYFIQTAVFTAMGEFIDTLHGMKKLEEIGEKDVLLNYSLKTARYTFDCPLVVGAILAGAGKKDVARLAEFGLLVGQAFQIQDDIIGIFDTQKNIGKSILSDLAESKKTILVCHAYRHLSGKRRQEFLRHFLKNRKTYADLVAVRRIFLQTGSLSYSLQEVEKRLTSALSIIGRLQMKKKHRRLLTKLTMTLFKPSRAMAEKYGVPFIL